MHNQPSEFLQFAIDCVRHAGTMQRDAFGGSFAVRKKGVIDLVTEVDLAIERHFRERVAAQYPEHVVLGEEFGAPDAAQASRPCWIFDPIDGTTNFAHGLPIFCASLALEVDGRLRVGAVYDPNRDELFAAERGGGAWLNGEPMHVSSTSVLSDALLVTGFPYTVHGGADDLVRLFGRFMATARAVRRLGSAALDICYVAAGRFDGFWELGLGAWDIAAGAVILEEAGGQLTDLDGSPFNVRTGRLLATNGHVHEAMRAVIAEHERDRQRAPNRTE